MGLAFVAIVAKLTLLQGVGSNQYLAVGSSEWTRTLPLVAERGAILDRNGNELAVSLPQTSIYADPARIADPGAEAAALAPVLGASVAKLRASLSGHNHFTYLARTVGDPVAQAVTALHLPGVFELAEPKRFYPAGQLGRPLLGATDVDGTGLAGLELQYQSVLQGKAGKLVEQTDRTGGPIPGGVLRDQPAKPGGDLVLTLDDSLQYDAEQALAQAIVAANAHSGIAMLMDRRSGAILADAQLTVPGPGTSTTPAVPVAIVAPAASGAAGSTNAVNGATSVSQPVESTNATSFTQVYEPGSVNKLVTISGALQDGVIQPSSMFTNPDVINVAGSPIHDAESHSTEHWNVTDILANSSNIGTLQIAQRLGKTGILKSIAAYGEGRKTDVNFPGESDGLLPTYWSGTTLAEVSFGQGISVTAIQVLAAYNAIANGGVYVAPRLVAGTVDRNGVEHPTPVTPGHQVVSPAVAAETTSMLDEVVRVGTGQAANLDPYTVAGKTGTASVPSPNGGYEAGHYVASFAGFVPAENPSITAMVVIDDTPDFGASASAPTFATLSRDALQELKVPPEAKRPPTDGVPLTNTETATAAGESAGATLPGLSITPMVPSGSNSTLPPLPSPATTSPPTPPTPTTAPASGAPASGAPASGGAVTTKPYALGAAPLAGRIARRVT